MQKSEITCYIFVLTNIGNVFCLILLAISSSYVGTYSPSLRISLKFQLILNLPNLNLSKHWETIDTIISTYNSSIRRTKTCLRTSTSRTIDRFDIKIRPTDYANDSKKGKSLNRALDLKPINVNKY